MNEKLISLEYENIIEYILYIRDRNPMKDWGHICGITTIYRYFRWNSKIDFLKYSNEFESKLNINNEFYIMILDWYNSNFQRIILDKYSTQFHDNFLYNFIYAISYDYYNENVYYFRFSESIDDVGYKYLLKSYKQNSEYLFTNIALASYYFHNQKLSLSYKFYINALKLDKDNPYLLYKFSILHNSLGGFDNNVKSEKFMKKVLELLPDSPFVYAGYGEILNIFGKYFEALKYFEIYEKLTKGEHRTFEPFMRKAESYIGLGDFKKARLNLDKINEYYFGEGYRFVYNELDNKLKKIGY